MPSLSMLVYDDAKLIEETDDALQSQGVSYEEAIEKAVMAIDKMTEDKALSYARAIVNLEETAEAIKEACKRQTARALAKANLAARMKQRLLELLPKDFKAEAADVSIRFQKNPTAVDDSKVELVSLRALRPDLFRVVPESVQLEKVKVKDALKAGEIIPGVKLAETYSVRIS